MVRITEHDPEPASASPRDAEAHKLEGNRAFGDGRFEDAERHYTAALEASASAADASPGLRACSSRAPPLFSSDASPSPFVSFFLPSARASLPRASSLRARSSHTSYTESDDTNT